MQIFKNTLLACSLIVAVSPLGLHAEDNAAQAAARAALQQKMRELNGAPAAETPAQPAAPEVVPPKPVEPVAAPTPAPVAPPPTVSAPGSTSPDLIEQAREATRARLRELQGNPTTSIPAGQESVAPEPKSAATSEMAPAVETSVPAKTSLEEGSKERISAKQQKAEAKAQAEAEKAAARQAAKEAKEAKKTGATEPAPAFSPLEAPASSLPASKELRLRQLTEQYVADKISAEEYHEQRAKILAEP